VELGNNASDTYVQCSSRLKGESYESQVSLSDINFSKKIARTWKMKKFVFQDLTEIMKMLKNWGIFG
jgi:hypothetical protein